MAFKTISVLLTGNATSLKAALATSAAQVQTFERSVQSSAVTGSRAASVLTAAVAAAGTAVAVGLAAATKSAIDFEQRMRNVNSISRLSEEALGALSEEVLDLSTRVPKSANDLAEGLYEVASAGFTGAEGLEVLEAAAVAASAGLSSTETAAGGILAVLNAYGLAASEAERVSDVLFETVNVGIITFEELAQNLGDVVGIGAAAGIEIDQLGAAVSAITLAGVPAAQAFTSLGRLMEKLIDPSDELALTYERLGISIEEDLADPAIGLSGVMDQLQEATGGNVTTLLALFPEIRAARAAFALAANDGENYRRTMAAIGDETAVAGATQEAFAEQTKALAAEARIFFNGIQAGAIRLGTHLIPVVRDVLAGLRSLGASALPSVQQGLAAAQPFFEALAQIGGDVADVISSLVSDLGPAAAALAGLGAAGVIASLNAAASLLASITGFLADHPELVATVAAAYAGWLVTLKALAAINLAKALAVGTIDRAAVGMFNLAGGAGAFVRSLGLLNAGAVGIGLVAVAALTKTVGDRAREADREFQDLIDSLREGVDASSLASVSDAAEKFRELAASAKETVDASRRGPLGDIAAAFAPGLDAVNDDLRQAKNSLGELTDEAERLTGREINLSENLNEIAHATGLTTEAVAELAKELGVDLGESWRDSKEARREIIDYYAELTGSAPEAAQAVKDGAAITTEALAEFEAQAAALSDLVEDVESAFAGATDILSFSGDEEGGLAQFLDETLEAAEAFAAQIEEAATRGLDPGIIRRLLIAGPEEAAPFLQAIAADHSGNLIELANQTEEALGEINAQVVAFARLTQQAINSTDDTKVRDLGDAMRITAETFDVEGERTAQAIATKLGLPLDRVRQVAKDFGITVEGLTGSLQRFSGDYEARVVVYGLDETLVKASRVFDVVRGILSTMQRVSGEPVPQVPNFEFRSEPAPSGFTPYGGLNFAHGGLFEDHAAQIAPAGAWRVWAEPETGGEAYIPLAPSKRERSVMVLGEVAERFGLTVMADGGVSGRRTGTAAAAGIDYQRLADATASAFARSGMRVEVDRRELGRVVSAELASVRTARS